MEIIWDTKNSKIIISFAYPQIESRQIDNKNNEYKSSSSIINKAIKKHLKGTDIRWTYGSSTEEEILLSSTLVLEIRFKDPHKDISVNKLNDILYNIDKEIQTEIKKLINL